MASVKCSFSFKHYEEILKLAKKKGYRFLRMKDYKPKGRIIYLRHDVDTNLKQALKIAGIEHKLKINSTFFLRLHASYNIYSHENHQIIKRIQEMGHEIGLHYFPGFKQDILKEKKIIELILGDKISGFSFHEPSRTKQKLKKIKGLYDAYDPKFVDDIIYISDSGGRWRYYCACFYLIFNFEQICILTHPMWWYDKSPLEGY